MAYSAYTEVTIKENKMNKNDGVYGGELMEDYSEPNLSPKDCTPEGQLRIRLENMKGNHEHGWYKQYTYMSLGCLLHWVYVYSMLKYAETVCSDMRGNLTYHGKPFASYTFDDVLQMPIFKFAPEYKWIEENQEIYVNNLRKHRNGQVVG